MDYYRANVSFSGIISMHEGEIRCITSKKLIKDLTKAGYIRKLNKKEIEAMKVLGLINEEEVIEDEGLDGDFDEGQDENLEEEQNDGKEDEENLSENQEKEEENGSDEDVITDEG